MTQHAFQLIGSLPNGIGHCLGLGQALVEGAPLIVAFGVCPLTFLLASLRGELLLAFLLSLLGLTLPGLLGAGLFALLGLPSTLGSAFPLLGVPLQIQPPAAKLCLGPALLLLALTLVLLVGLYDLRQDRLAPGHRALPDHPERKMKDIKPVLLVPHKVVDKGVQLQVRTGV
jgi:hypothetical protein